MPFDYVIDPERRLILTTAQGVVTVAEVRSKLERLLGDPDFNPDLDEVIDATCVDEMHVPVTEVFEFLDECILSKTSRTAWIVIKSGKWAMLADMFATWMSRHGECRVFHDTPSALEWLGAMESARPDHRYS